MQYPIAFRFELDSSTTPLNATLTITDTNSISLAAGMLQLQPYGPSTTPPLTYCNVSAEQISFQAGSNTSGTKQAIQITAYVKAVGTSMTVNLEFNGTAPTVSYQFLGTSSQAALGLGPNTIPFPNSN